MKTHITLGNFLELVINPSPKVARSVQKASILFPKKIILWGPSAIIRNFDHSQFCPNLCCFPESSIYFLYLLCALILSPHLCIWLLFPVVPSTFWALLISLHKLALTNPLFPDAASPALLLPGQTQLALAELWGNPLLSVECELLNLSQTLLLLLLICSLGLH